MNTTTRRRGRLVLAGLAALFFVPLALSFYLYYGTDWRPSGGTQHGELISPARPLPEVSLPTAAGTDSGPDLLRGSWHLVYVGSGDCPDACRQALTTLRQVRFALNKDMDRVNRVFLYAGGSLPREYLAAQQPDLVAADASGEAGGRLLAAFPQDRPPLSAGDVYIVDPLGNLMMRYPGDSPPKPIHTDLERLLKLSHIG